MDKRQTDKAVRGMQAAERMELARRLLVAHGHNADIVEAMTAEQLLQELTVIASRKIIKGI